MPVSTRIRGWHEDAVDDYFGAFMGRSVDSLDSFIGHKVATVAANTVITNVVIGTPVVTAIPADSLVVSVKRASGDLLIVLNDGSGNSWEWERFDSSAGLHVLNEAGSDIDFRIEGDNNANMMVVDAGLDSLSHGAAVVTGAFMAISPYAQNRNYVTSVGAIHVPAGTWTDAGAARTVAVVALCFVGAGTLTNATNAVTGTDTAALVVTVPVAGTNYTATRLYSIWATGQIRADSNFQVNNTATFGTTQPTAAVVFQSGTAPAGAITTGGALYTSTTAIRKIIAAGTDSLVET